VGVVELVSLRVPLTANDEPAWIVSAFAAGLIARAVANATNANANFFMFPSGD
jgi:flavoprotein